MCESTGVWVWHSLLYCSYWSIPILTHLIGAFLLNLKGGTVGVLGLNKTTCTRAWLLQSPVWVIYWSSGNANISCNEILTLFGGYTSLIEFDYRRLVSFKFIVFDVAHVCRLRLRGCKRWGHRLVKLVGGNLSHRSIIALRSRSHNWLMLSIWIWSAWLMILLPCVFLSIKWPSWAHPLYFVTGEVLLGTCWL